MITITGIDGCGKSSAIKNLKALPELSDINFISCPRYHHQNQNKAQMNQISSALELGNSLSDTLKSRELKAVTVFLQLYLFKEYFNRQKSNISERHPLFDSIVYGPVLSAGLADRIEKNLWAKYEQEVKTHFPKDYQAIVQWCQLTLESSLELESYLDACRALKHIFQLPADQMIIKLKKIFQLDFPEKLIILDIEPDYAVKLISTRDRQNEMHENKEGLTKLRNLIRRAQEFAQDYVDITVIPVNPQNSEERIKQKLLEKIVPIH